MGFDGDVARRRTRPRGRLAACAAAGAALAMLALLVPVTASGSAAAAPTGPPPNGYELAPGAVPGYCTGPSDDAYGTNFGYYWSETSGSWIQAPRCYPRWGYLQLSPSQIATAGDTVTVSAQFDDGRIAAWIPIKGGMSWSAPGTVVQGCGDTDLDCTVRLGDPDNPPAEWAWSEFHLSAPGRYFVLPPSYAPRCQETDPCLDTTTQAWSWAGVHPGSAVNHPPVADFLPERVAAGWDLWRFTSQASDPDVGDSITSQTWEFGDGDAATGATVIHTYRKPGSYTVSHRVVDSHGVATTSTQVVSIPAPTLSVAVSLPDAPNGELAPGNLYVARVTVTAGDDGLGNLSQVGFDGGLLQVAPLGAITVYPPPLPPSLILGRGQSQSFDALLAVDPAAGGTFSLSSTVHAVDLAGHAVAPVTATVDGTVSGFVVELDTGARSEDGVDVVLTVRNVGAGPIEGIRWSGNGLSTHPEYVPDELRGAVTPVSGPEPALPTRLDPGEVRQVRYRFRAEAPGDVAVVAEAQANIGNATISVNDSGWVSATRRVLSAKELEHVIADLAQGELEYLRSLATSWQTAATASIDRAIQQARAQGGLKGFPPSPVQSGGGPVELDNVKLTKAALWGYAKGLGRGVAKTADFAVFTPVDYYASIVSNGDFAQAAQDYAAAGVAAEQGVSAVAYGALDKAITLYNAAAAELDTPDGAFNQQQYTDITEALNDDYKGQQLRLAEIAPQVQAQQAKFDAYIDGLEYDILKDPYGWADQVTGTAGELGGETLAGEALLRGGTKLAEKAIESYEYSRFGQSGAAANRLTSAETLESLGAGETTPATIEKLAGITRSDQAKIDSVIGEVKQKFGVDVELQARPSNPYSVKFLNSELGAVGKPEIFKAKNITDVDVILGADESALGQLGVYQPHLPPQQALAKMPPELANDVQLRYETQKKVWKDWNDSSSVFRQNYERAAQKGGGNFEFQVPGATGDAAANGPRNYHIEVELSKPGRNHTQTFFERPTGKPIVSDIDFHAYVKSSGDALDAGTRGQIELYLQRRWKETGIAFGDHGATLNGFDWPGSGVGGGAVARHKFGLEFMEPAAAKARAEELSAQLGVPAEELLKGYVPGKFVVIFRRGSVATGHGKTF